MEISNVNGGVKKNIINIYPIYASAYVVYIVFVCMCGEMVRFHNLSFSNKTGILMMCLE